MAAVIQSINHPRYSHQIVVTDPTRSEPNGRAKRLRYFFRSEAEAVKKLRTLNQAISAGGVPAVALSPTARRDYLDARALLDGAGFNRMQLAEVAQRWLDSQAAGPASRELVQPLLDRCLDAKTRGEGLAHRARQNLEIRVLAWLDRQRIVTLSDITREACLALRDRPGVSAATRKNDMNAVSSFLSWLVQEQALPINPLAGQRRPRVEPKTPTIYTASQARALLAAAASYKNGRHARAVGLLFLAGLRPSEVPQAQLDLEHPTEPAVRVTGGKLRGRANRIVRLTEPAARWLAAQPDGIDMPTTGQRLQIVKRANGVWHQDGARHSWISARLTASNDENATAREAGTSPDIIFRHYHRLMTQRQAEEWLALGLP